MHRVPVQVVIVNFRGVAIQPVLCRVALGHADQLDEIERLELRATHHGHHPVEAHALMAQKVEHQSVARDPRLEVDEVVRHCGRIDVHAASFLLMKLEAKPV
jgi:hypothetical protein